MMAEHVTERGGDRHYVETADGRERYQLRVVETKHGFGVRQMKHSRHGARSDLRHSTLLCRDTSKAEANRIAEDQAQAISRHLDSAGGAA